MVLAKTKMIVFLTVMMISNRDSYADDQIVSLGYIFITIAHFYIN